MLYINALFVYLPIQRITKNIDKKNFEILISKTKVFNSKNIYLKIQYSVIRLLNTFKRLHYR